MYKLSRRAGKPEVRSRKSRGSGGRLTVKVDSEGSTADEQQHQHHHGNGRNLRVTSSSRVAAELKTSLKEAENGK